MDDMFLWVTLQQDLVPHKGVGDLHLLCQHLTYCPVVLLASETVLVLHGLVFVFTHITKLSLSRPGWGLQSC